MSNFILAESNFMLFASKNYSNPVCLDVKEFHSDLRKIRYIHRLLLRYSVAGEIKERLLLNHLILFYNVFDVDAATKILFFKIPKKHWPQLKTFLVYLNYMPSFINNIEEKPIPASSINLDMRLVDILRKI